MTRFSRCWISALLTLVPLACATGEQNGPDGATVGGSSNNAGQTSAGAGGGNTSGASSVGGMAGGGGSSTAGAGTSGATTAGGGGTPNGGMAGSSSGMGGVASGGAGSGGGGAGSGGGGAGGTAGAAGKGGSGGTTGGGGSAGAPAGGAGNGGGGNGGSAGSGSTNYCDTHAKSPLPYVVNDGFQPAVYEGDTPAVAFEACATRAPGAVGNCSTWHYTPNAVTPSWAGVLWSTYWDSMYTHPPVCIADGATKVTFQARGAVGGEQVTFSAAGSAEVPMTLTNAWKAYSLSLVGVTYNTTVDGVEAGFFWKADPNVGTITFYVDDIQIEK